MRILRNAAAILFMLALAPGAGCSGGFAPASPAIEPSITHTPAPTQMPGPTGPSHFTTYTDEGGIFSISYPQDWEAPLWMLEDITESTVAVLESIQSGLPLEEVSILFFAGLPMADGWDPNVTVVVEPVPAGTFDLEHAVDASVRGIKLFSPDYNELSRENTSVSGRDATILEFTASMDPTGKGRFRQMFMLQENVIWGLSCTTEPAKFNLYDDTFNNILQSFRLLR